MDDIFVIIITLIIAVVGALSRKKKKGANNAPVTSESNESSGFWDTIMGAQNGVEMPEEEFAGEEVVTENLKREPEKYSRPSVKRTYKFSAANEGESQIEEKIVDVRKKKKSVLVDGENFSLRKAVIYNEIMNRKYL